MKIKESYIILDNLYCYAYHGVAPQERVVGNEYQLWIKLKVTFSASALSDNLDDTVSYADVSAVVKEEMAIPSKLLEHVSARIAKRIFNDFGLVEEITLRLFKRNPPMGDDIDHAGVEIVCTR